MWKPYNILICNWFQPTLIRLTTSAHRSVAVSLFQRNSLCPSIGIIVIGLSMSYKQRRITSTIQSIGHLFSLNLEINLQSFWFPASCVRSRLRKVLYHAETIMPQDDGDLESCQILNQTPQLIGSVILLDLNYRFLIHRGITHPTYLFGSFRTSRRSGCKLYLPDVNRPHLSRKRASTPSSSRR